MRRGAYTIRVPRVKKDAGASLAVPKRGALASVSQLEEAFFSQVLDAKLPTPEREYRFDTERRWRFDFAWPDEKVAVEVEGGVWRAGRHNRPDGFIKDCEKYAAAQLRGWIVLRVVGEHVASGEALKWTMQALGVANA